MTITLNLTPKEAKVMHNILRSIGGSLLHTRGIADSICQKIAKQKHKFHEADVDLTMRKGLESIYFDP